VGRRFRLDEETEIHLDGLLKDLAGWRIPLGSQEVRQLVKGYLDKKGIKDPVRKFFTLRSFLL